MEGRLGGLLESRGYEPSGLAPLRASGAVRTRLKIEDKLQRLRFQQRRLGTSLALQAALSNRLPVPGWRDSVNRRVNDITLAYLK